MIDIFISYARTDKKRAELLSEAFSRQGWSVWWDREIPPGKSFDETIESALNSARCVIVLWSKDSVSSRWVKTEAAEGAARGILIPALIDKVQIPLEFKRIEAADLSDWPGTSPHFEFDQLLKTVASILGGSPTTQIKPMPTRTKSRSRRWWKTMPGLVTAAAGIVAAVAGLFVMLHQIGPPSNKEKTASVSSSSDNDTTERLEATAPSAKPAKTTEPSKAKSAPSGTKTLADDRVTRYSVAFPSGTEVTLQNNRGEGTYKILAALVDSRNTGILTLKLSIRLTNKGPSDLGFGNDSFRLLIDGVPRAPKSWLNDLVEPRSAKESDVIFEMPETAESIVLSVTSGPETANIPIILKKSD